MNFFSNDDVLDAIRVICFSRHIQSAAMSQLVRKERKPPATSPSVNAEDEALATTMNSHLSIQEAADSSKAHPGKEPTFRCRYHLGTVVGKVR
jgi:hypothetical protein